MSHSIKQIFIRLSLIVLVVLLKSNFIYIFSIINIPLQYIETFLHETGHAIACLLTGGMSYKIELGNLDGGAAGLAYTDGGIRGAVLLGGYMMPPIVGMVLYISLNHSFNKTVRYIPYIFAGYALVVGLLWVRDIITFLFIMMVWYIFRRLSYMECNNKMKETLRFFAIYFISSGFFSSYIAFDSFNPKSDVHRLARLFHISIKESMYIWWYSTSAMCFLCLISDYISVFKEELYKDYNSLLKKYPPKEKKEDVLVNKEHKNNEKDSSNINPHQW